MDEIKVVKDRPYKRVDDRELNFDVYRPPQSDLSDRLPVVVYVHGEGPPEVIENFKDWGQYDGWGRLIAAYYGRMSLKPIREGIEGEVSEGLLDEFSSVVHLRSMPTESVPPIFIAKAELDDLVGVNESIDEAIEVARARNIPVTVANHPLGEHGMDVRNDDDRMREIIDETLQFFRRHLGLEVPE